MKIKTTLELDGQYSAIDTDSYDGAPDSTTNFVGHGSDSWEAIQDLRNMIYDAERESEIQKLQNLLERCRHALTFVPVDALGFGTGSDNYGGEYRYPYRDELISNLNTAIKRNS